MWFTQRKNRYRADMPIRLIIRHLWFAIQTRGPTNTNAVRGEHKDFIASVLKLGATLRSAAAGTCHIFLAILFDFFLDKTRATW